MIKGSYFFLQNLGLIELKFQVVFSKFSKYCFYVDDMFLKGCGKENDVMNIDECVLKTLKHVVINLWKFAGTFLRPKGIQIYS